MIFNKIKKGISEAIIFAGYSRTASELLTYSDKHLADIGISRELLEQGATAFPWRAEVETQVIPDNVTNLDFTKTASEVMSLPETPKAA